MLELIYAGTNLIIQHKNNMINIILWIVFGAIAGWLASIIMKTNAEQGSVMNIIVGVIGAVIGGYIMNTFGSAGVTGFNLYSLIVSVVGAVILLAIVKMVRR